MNLRVPVFTLLSAIAFCAAAAPLQASTRSLQTSTRVDESPATVAQGASGTGAVRQNAVPASDLSCPGFAHTRVIDLSWSNPRRMFTREAGGLGLKDALVIRFTTGPSSSEGILPRISAGEYRSAPNWRFATLSAKPCDFEPQPKPGATITGNSITAIFALGSDRAAEYYPVLENNQTYYLNIRNSPDSNCAASGVCDMFVDLIKSGSL